MVLQTTADSSCPMRQSVDLKEDVAAHLQESCYQRALLMVREAVRSAKDV